MQSIAFPNIFSNMYTNTVEDKEATKQNLLLLLSSEKTSLFGDPYFGTTLKKVIYEQNTGILADLVIDALYTAIQQFMPQIYLQRKDIRIELKGRELYAKITYRNLIDYQLDSYTINLTEDTLEG